MAKIPAIIPYSNFAVDTVEVILILGRQPRLLLHLDYCRTFVNAVWRVQQMPSHLVRLIATENCHRMVETVHSYAVQVKGHRSDLCMLQKKKQKTKKANNLDLFVGIVCVHQSENMNSKNEKE